MAPKHKNPSNARRTAVAPYNFVAVPDRLLAYEDREDGPRFVDHGEYHANRLTGWIDVELETRAPLYVRGSLTPAEYERMEREERDEGDNKTPHLKKVRNKPDFFNTGDAEVPVIPGSSVRGMLRTLAQILSYGKLAPVSDTPLAYRALADMSSQGEAYRVALMEEDPTQKNHFTPRFRAGYINKREDDRWVIRPAQEINGTTYARIYIRDIPRGLKRWHKCKNAQILYMEPGPYQFQKVRGGFLHVRYARVLRVLDHPAPGLTQAVLARSGKMFKKNSEAVVFPPDPQAAPIPIPDGTDDDSRDLVTAYRDQVTPAQMELLGSKEGVLQEHQPVFYLMEGGRLVFFGHTQMFRMVYEHSPREMLPPEHYDVDRTDLAEAIFGVAKGSQGGRAGRVFVSDAIAEPGQDGIWLVDENGVIPEILSSPKPTTFQHYLTQSRPDVPNGKGLLDYNDSPRATTLRGFKLYWHKGNTPLNALKEKSSVDLNKDTQHTRIRPVRSGVRFRLRIRFENLLLDELGLLWRTLDLPTAGDYAHKLGMAKPLGLGAIRVTPKLTLVDPSKRYRKLFADGNDWETAVVSDDLTEKLRQRAVADFEKLVVDFVKEPNVTQFDRLERVRQLVAMLSWPGPQPPSEKTRYMEIERRDPTAKRGKRNEYRERPVLPDPLAEI